MSDERLLRTSQNCTCHFFANSFSNATSHNDHLFKKMDPSKGAWQEEKGTIEIPFIPLYLFTIVLNLLSNFNYTVMTDKYAVIQYAAW